MGARRCVQLDFWEEKRNSTSTRVHAFYKHTKTRFLPFSEDFRRFPIVSRRSHERFRTFSENWVTKIVFSLDGMLSGIVLQSKTVPLFLWILGVAFEQGKFLPTPETVPFRLTRDMVDGMGLTGVEGVCRRCCEKTMEVMRTSHESLMTVVEVSFLVDKRRLLPLEC